MSKKEEFLAQYGSAEHLAHITNSSHEQTTKELALGNPHLSDSDMDKAVNSSATYIRAAVAKNPRLSNGNIDKLVSDESDDVRVNIGSNENLTHNHIKKLMSDPSHWVPPSMVSNKAVKKEHAQLGFDNLIKQESHFAAFFKNSVKANLGHDVR